MRRKRYENERIFIKDALKRVRGFAPVPSKVWAEAPWRKTGSAARGTAGKARIRKLIVSQMIKKKQIRILNQRRTNSVGSLTSKWSIHL